MLHITNGSSVELNRTNLGTVIYWNDVLHEGPVPANLSLQDLSDVRARFLSDYFGHADVSFIERNEHLATYREHEEVVLWFEHDLYDQLQLIQLLDWFAHQAAPLPKLSLINIDRYLGYLTVEELIELFGTRVPVTPEQLRTAVQAWVAFRSPEPTGLTRFVHQGTPGLPFLSRALRRHLEQFPAVRNGTSRTEHQILHLVSTGHRNFHELFRGDQQMEDAIFMGDSTFRRHVLGLAHARRPLLKESDAGYELTAFGRAVLDGAEDHVRANGINRWLGGVHLCEGAPVWRWDSAGQRLVP